MPFQTETCSSQLGDFITDSGKFYVRNHAPVPGVDSALDHEITFAFNGDEIDTLSLKQLAGRFQSYRITSILQCTGNRAADNIAANGFKSSGFVGGDSEFIGSGMLGNAIWQGPRLDEVLKSLLPLESLSQAEVSNLHVIFEGLDGYYTSIPLSIALDEDADCLLATEMNGANLSPDHGYPIRALLPGIAGARNVKWLCKISVGKEQDSPWTRHYYRDGSHPRRPIYGLPMNSIILSPEPGAWLDARASSVKVRGVAFAGASYRP